MLRPSDGRVDRKVITAIIDAALLGTVLCAFLLALSAGRARAAVIVDSLVNSASAINVSASADGVAAAFQPFVTNNAAYTVSSLTMGLDLTDFQGSWAVRLLGDNSDTPGATLTSFTILPGQALAGQIDIGFAPQLPTILQPDTRYWIELTNNSISNLGWLTNGNTGAKKTGHGGASLEPLVTEFIPGNFDTASAFGQIRLEGDLVAVPVPSTLWLALQGIGLAVAISFVRRRLTR